MPRDLRVQCVVALIQWSLQKTSQIGKTQLQKLTYFLQQAGVPLDYRFEIYHYGPYSFELAEDIGMLDSLSIINVESDPSGFGFRISPGEFAKSYDVPPRHRKPLEEVIEKIGADSPVQLEVKATVHFVQTVMLKKGTAPRAAVVQHVRALKPQFTERFIQNCYDELKQQALL